MPLFYTKGSALSTSPTLERGYVCLCQHQKQCCHPFMSKKRAVTSVIKSFQKNSFSFHYLRGECRAADHALENYQIIAKGVSKPHPSSFIKMRLFVVRSFETSFVSILLNWYIALPLIGVDKLVRAKGGQLPLYDFWYIVTELDL